MNLFGYGSGQRDRRFTSSQGLCSDWNDGKRASVIIVRIAMHALPKNQKEVMQTLLSMIESTGKERGSLSHHVFRDIEDENIFSLIDEWETREDLDQHIRSAKFGVLLGTKSLLCEPVKIQVFTVSDSEGIEAVNSVRKKETDFTHIHAVRSLQI